MVRVSNAEPLMSAFLMASVLFAMEEFKELRALVERGFKEEGDVEKAFTLVQRSKGIERTHALAKYLFLNTKTCIAYLQHTSTHTRSCREHCDRAVDAISMLKPSPYRDALARLTDKVLSRTN